MRLCMHVLLHVPYMENSSCPPGRLTSSMGKNGINVYKFSILTYTYLLKLIYLIKGIGMFLHII